MIYIRPDFYDRFRCSASRCRHSCCKGWEIDIDGETAELYEQLPGEAGEEIRACISRDGTPHFTLTEDGNCPFLEENGLCKLIRKYGDGILCDICREHPRFYNEYGGREEAGLGLCCEESVKLLLSSCEPLEFISDSDGDSEQSLQAECARFELRDRLYAILTDREVPLLERFSNAAFRFGFEDTYPSPVQAAGFYAALERMDPAWDTMLSGLTGERYRLPDDARYERLAVYFVYRHFMDLAAADTVSAVRFCLFSVLLIAEITESGFPLEEVIRIYSSEIEYSDVNIGKITGEFL